MHYVATKLLNANTNRQDSSVTFRLLSLTKQWDHICKSICSHQLAEKTICFKSYRNTFNNSCYA